MLFTEENNRYDKKQVDDYISRLSEQYQAVYDENQELSNKYNNLMEEYEKLKTQDQSGLNGGIIAKTLLSTEILIKKIIDDANIEAIKIKEEAQKTLDNAHDESAQIFIQVKNTLEQAHKVTEQASSDIQKLLTFEHIEKNIL